MGLTISDEEASSWLDTMGRDRQIDMVQDYHRLKQMCSQILAVSTGEADWIDRAIKKSESLRETERQFERVVRSGLELLEDARWRAKETTCTICMGRGRVQGQTCCICHGTGARAI